MIERLIAHEESGGSVHHIHYAALMADPLAEMRKLYERFDEPFRADVEIAIGATLAANPKGKHRKHAYRLEDYGLTREGIHGHFRRYISRYDIPTRP